MYSDKAIVNLITSLLVAKGVRRAVVCPGSRNVPFINNFMACPDIACTAVTDERSAAFYALGMSLATREPVVVCVTSGSALLNTAPAVAEAYYRHVPLIVVSADRQKEWIDRHDGQTIRQDGALANVVREQACVSEFSRDDRLGCDFSTLLLNMTLNAAVSGAKGPVHVNVHLKEPLFEFNVGTLPEVRNIQTTASDVVGSAGTLAEQIMHRFISSEMGMIVIGQQREHDSELDAVIRELQKYYVVVAEPLATAAARPFDNVLTEYSADLKRLPVNFLLSMGGTLVSKNLRQLLRTLTVAEHWEVDADGKPHDTFGCQTGVVWCGTKVFLKCLLDLTLAADRKVTSADKVLRDRWYGLMAHAEDSLEGEMEDFSSRTAAFSEKEAVRLFELSLEDMEYDFHVHYANSMEVRLGCMYARHFVWCNRGVNGIEGSISTAAGFSLATDDVVFCVTGDLSFFYDQNSLWNSSLKGNLRVLLLNNGGGAIFSKLKGLDVDDRELDVISGKHTVDAHGICEQNDIGYLQAKSEQEYRVALVRLLTEQTKRPIVLEAIF